MSDRCSLILADWKQAVSKLCSDYAAFDIVILDPPYAMHDLTPVMDALKPLLKPDAVIVLEHEAKVFPSTPDGFELYDNRRYGIAGVSFFRLWQKKEE